MKKSGIIFAVFIALAVLHQDFWNWDNGNLVFGVLPVALAYHGGYSLVVALFWAMVIRFAWPTKLEEWADGGDGGDPPAAAATANVPSRPAPVTAGADAAADDASS